MRLYELYPCRMIFDALTSILEDLLGKHGEQPVDALGLRLVLLGSPELSLQGEILHRLRAQGFNAAIECGVGARKKRLDLVAFDNTWQPLAAVEFKHRMSNQGAIKKLLQDMNDDRVRYQESTTHAIPFIQVGLFTEVHEVRDHAENAHGFYRVLSASSYGLVTRERPPKHNLSNQQLPAGDFLVAPARRTLQLGSVSVTGTVGYVLRSPSWQRSS